MNAFLTGSQVYGTPRDDSDIDLVVMLTGDDFDLLAALSGEAGFSGGHSFRHGSLNIIALSPNEFDVWKEATEQLIAMKPVTRQFAVEHIAALTKARAKQAAA